MATYHQTKPPKLIPTPQLAANIRSLSFRCTSACVPNAKHYLWCSCSWIVNIVCFRCNPKGRRTARIANVVCARRDHLLTLLAVGVEAEAEKVSKLLAELEGKDINEVIAAGKEKLASVPSGGAVAAAPAAGGAGAAAPAKEEAKKEESEEDEVSSACTKAAVQHDATRAAWDIGRSSQGQPQ